MPRKSRAKVPDPEPPPLIELPVPDVDTSAPPTNPIQETVYSIGCNLENMYAALFQQYSQSGIPNPSEAAVATMQQGYNSAMLSIQITYSVQINKDSNLIGFNRG